MQIIPDKTNSGSENSKDITTEGHVDELEGSLEKSGNKEDKLMSSVDSGEAENNDGKVAEEMINNAIGSFSPDMMFQNLVTNYKNAKKLYGETIIRELSDFEPGYIEKNVNIPEFQKELKKNIASNVKDLKSNNIINSDFVLTDEGLDKAAIYLCNSELDKLKINGFGNRKTKEYDMYGEKDTYSNFKKGNKYKDVSVAQTIKNAARRQHKNILIEDIKVYDRKKTGKVDVIYCLDSSGSMKGEKIGLSKRAGVALAYKAILDKNKVGLLVFSSEIKKIIPLTSDFNLILSELIRIRAHNQTNIKKVITEATEMLKGSRNTKHIVVLSDAMPNIGETKEIYETTAVAAARGITISFIGINLDDKGIEIAEKIVDIGKGRLYKVSKMDNVDSILLEDYEFARRG